MLVFTIIFWLNVLTNRNCYKFKKNVFNACLNFWLLININNNIYKIKNNLKAKIWKTDYYIYYLIIKAMFKNKK